MGKKFFYYFRKLQTSNNKLLLPFYRCMFFKIKEKHGVEISYKTQIGKGFYLGYPYNITINPKTTIGEYCSVHRGVLIGQENRGKRKGAPTCSASSVACALALQSEKSWTLASSLFRRSAPYT